MAIRLAADGGVTLEREGILATWCGDNDHGLAHIITGHIGSHDRAECGVDMAPLPILKTDTRPRCGICVDKFDGTLTGHF